jgi:hypothetical protein
MRRFFILLIAIAAGGAAAPAQATDTWYAQRITAGDTPLRVEHFWSKGRQVRMETVIRSQPLITLVKGELYTVIDPVKRRGIAIRRAPGAVRYDREHPNERPFASDAALILAEGAEKVDTETTSGGSSTHYRLSDHRGRREVWMTNSEPSLPVRVIRYDRATGSTVRQDFVDWARELDLPDDFFEPYAGLAIEQLDYAEYLRRAGEESAYLLPVLMRELLHGRN